MIGIYLMIGMIISALIFKIIFDNPDMVDVTMEVILKNKFYTVVVFAVWTVVWPYLIYGGIKYAIDKSKK